MQAFTALRFTNDSANDSGQPPWWVGIAPSRGTPSMKGESEWLSTGSAKGKTRGIGVRTAQTTQALITRRPHPSRHRESSVTNASLSRRQVNARESLMSPKGDREKLDLPIPFDPRVIAPLSEAHDAEHELEAASNPCPHFLRDSESERIHSSAGFANFARHTTGPDRASRTPDPLPAVTGSVRSAA